ncbi:MAG: hypothetical protein ACXU8O_00670 [Asticcacaulis sp.]
MDGHPDTEIATPAQDAALRITQRQRLKDQAEFLLRAYEALEPPTDYAGIEKAAKALMAVDKAMTQICTADDHEEDEMPEDGYTQTGAENRDPDRPANDDLAAWRDALERKILRFADARRRARMDATAQPGAVGGELRRNMVGPEGDATPAPAGRDGG